MTKTEIHSYKANMDHNALQHVACCGCCGAYLANLAAGLAGRPKRRRRKPP